MAAGTTVFQSTTLATPAAGMSVMGDAVNDATFGAGTAQYVKIMDGAAGGTAKASVTTANGMLVDVSRVQGTVQALGSVQTVGTAQVLGSVQPVGTAQVLGSIQLVGTNQALGTVAAQGFAAHGAAVAGAPLLWGAFGSSGTQAAVSDGQVTRLWADLNGRLQIRGTIDSIGTVQVLGSIQTVGTSQVLGSVQTVGTSQVLGSVQPVGTVQVLGTVQTHGTSQVLGSISAQGYIAHDSAAAGNPVLAGAFGSSGTQAAVNDGDAVRLWADLNGRLQVRGTIDSMPTVTVTGTVQPHGTTQVLGSVQPVGTAQVLGSVQTVGTSQVLGTVQTHGTSQVLGSVSAQGHIAHDSPVGGNPVLIGAFGSSGTQAAVADGDTTRLWADLNGRLQVRGTIDSMPAVTGTVQTHGTSQVIGTVQAHGTAQVIGTVQPHGTAQVLGSVQPVGTVQALGSVSVQGFTAANGGSVNPIQTGGRSSHARPGTVSVGSAVAEWYDLHGRAVVQVGNGTTDLLGTFLTAAGNGTMITGRGAGSWMRIYDLLISGSAAGTVRLLEDGTLRWGPIFLAANGGWNMNSAVGVKLPNANTSLVASVTAGTWGITIHYGVEGA